MLENMPGDLPFYWMAFNGLRDPARREERRLAILEKENPDQFLAEITALQLAEREKSLKRYQK